MSLLEWTNENSVKVVEIDQQHQKIFFIINRLYDLMTQSKAQEEITEIMNELVEYSTYHFDTEEKYFKQFNFEDKENHILRHNTYKQKITELIENNKKDGGLLISYSVLDFLEDWWLEHINIVDKKYITCFKEHGLQ